MVQTGTGRYRGFAPWELSRLQNEFVLLEHAEAASTKWVSRARAVDSPRYDLPDLAKLDAKLDAQLDALCLSMQYGDQLGLGLCTRQLHDLGGRGEVFVATFMAARFHAAATLDSLYAALDEEPALAPAMSSALGWSTWDVAWPVIDALWQSKITPRQTVALTGLSLHLHDPSMMIDEAAASVDPRLRARAARTVGELGITTRTDLLRALAQDRAAEVRFFAARSLLLLGARDPDVSLVLSQLAETDDPHGPEAADLLMRVMPEPTAHAWYDRLLALGVPRSGIAGAAAQGSPSFVTRLIDLMADDELCKAAGLGLTMITGVDLEREDLDAEAVSGAGGAFRPLADPKSDRHDLAPAESDEPDEADEPDEPDEHPQDADAARPDPERVRAWWAEQAPNYLAGRRYLAGLAIDAGSLPRVLARAKQPQRHAAAIEQALASPGVPLYRTRQSGLSQARELLGWT